MDVAQTLRAQKQLYVDRPSDGSDSGEQVQESLGTASNFTNSQEDPMVDKLRMQLGVIHPMPSPPINRNIVGLFALFFFVGVIFDKLWMSRKKIKSIRNAPPSTWPQVPTSFPSFLEKDLQKKESVEWVNMVLGKLWKVYRAGIENWIVRLLQPVIDDIKKPDYVQRVEIKQFSLGDEPLSVRNVERRTSRRADDLQYQIGLRYTGGADLDLSRFLTKLLTEDLPQLFVLPTKCVVDFQKGRAVSPVSDDFATDMAKDGNKDFVGELSVTLLDAQKLPYAFYAKTDPYVVLRLGDQVYRSKKNSQTTIIGPPGEPIWNQDFLLLVANPKKQRLCIQVRDSFGFTDFSIGTAEVMLSSLQDTVPLDKVVILQGGWGVFRKGASGEILLRLTYKAYVEDEEDYKLQTNPSNGELSDDESMKSDQFVGTYKQDQQHHTDEIERESFMDVLETFHLSDEFQGIVASETGNTKSSKVTTSSATISPNNRRAEFVPLDSDRSFEAPGGSALFWFAVIVGIALLISINIGGSSLFNP
ncbi:hypothetical protein ACLOJK_017177 [Asimina triloba]